MIKISDHILLENPAEVFLFVGHKPDRTLKGFDVLFIYLAAMPNSNAYFENSFFVKQLTLTSKRNFVSVFLMNLVLHYPFCSAVCRAIFRSLIIFCRAILSLSNLAYLVRTIYDQLVVYKIFGS